jgi:hypothetical protein
MVATTNIDIAPIDGWVAIGDDLTHVAIQHLHQYKELDMTFGDTAPSLSVIGHPLAKGEMESGIIGSQLWVRSPDITITAIVTA